MDVLDTVTEDQEKIFLIVKKRKINFEYLKSLLVFPNMWMNIVIFKEQDQSLTLQDRILPFFYLGISLSNILSSKLYGINLLNKTLKLFEEWEYFISGFSAQSVKFVMARVADNAFPHLVASMNTINFENFTGENNTASLGLSKFNGEVIFEFLQTPHIALNCGYTEVLRSLFDTLNDIYYNFYNAEFCRLVLC